MNKTGTSDSELTNPLVYWILIPLSFIIIFLLITGLIKKLLSL